MENKEAFIDYFIDNGFSKTEALKSWEVIYQTYKESLSYLSLPNVITGKTDLEVLQYLKDTGELNEIKERALQRLDRL
jgi:hypothetical protein